MVLKQLLFVLQHALHGDADERNSLSFSEYWRKEELDGGEGLVLVQVVHVGLTMHVQHGCQGQDGHCSHVTTFPMSAYVKAGFNLSTNDAVRPAVAKPCQQQPQPCGSALMA